MSHGRAFAQESVAIGHFSTASSIEAAGWKPMRLRGHDKDTQYTLHTDNGVQVLQASAEDAMSGLTFPVNIDPKQHPILTFRFKVEKLPANADLKTKRGDDFGARVYVMFDYDIARLPFGERTKLRLARTFYGSQVPSAALNYVWDAKYPVGTSAWNAFTESVRMFVVESGDAKLGQWVTVRRNVAEDFKSAFGTEAPRIVGVAVVTDADNTHTAAGASYGDITFKAQ